MSSVTGFALRFFKSQVWQNVRCSCRTSIFLINYTDKEPLYSEVGVCVRFSQLASIIILILTINQIHDRLLEWTVGGGNLRPSVVTSLTSTSDCIICWWKTYLDCMNNNILCLTLCCDMHFIYWPQLDFCIDFADTVCLRRFFMDFPAAIWNDPLWSLSVRPSSGKAWKIVILFTIMLYLAPSLYATATQGISWFHTGLIDPRRAASASLGVVRVLKIMFPAESHYKEKKWQ